MTKAYNKIRQGLIEAIDFANGKQTGARINQVDVPESRGLTISGKPDPISSK